MKVFKVIFVLLIAGNFGLTAQDIVSNLVVCLPMNGNANDMSGNNNNATVYNATLTADRFNNPNSAYYFDGIDAYLEIPNSVSLSNIESNDELTISVWCNVMGWYQNWNVFAIANKYNVSDDLGWDHTLMSPNACPEVVFIPNRPVQADPCHFSDQGTTTFSVWTHYVMTFSKASGLLVTYKNGVAVKTMTTGGLELENTGSGSVFIGYSPADVDEYSLGAMDDFRMYNRALTATEVALLYNSQACTCQAPSNPSAIIGNTTVCPNSQNVYGIAPVNGATSYSWAIPGGWTGTSTTSTIGVTAGVNGGIITVWAINNCTTSTSGTMAVNVTDCTMGLKEFISDYAVSIFPNPSSGSFTIEGAGISGLDVKIYDVTGRLIHAEKTSLSKMEVNLHVSPGLYHAKVFSDAKLLKQLKLSIQ